MKNLIFKHHKAAQAAIHILAILFCILGFLIAILLNPNDEMNGPAFVFMFGGLIIGLAVEVLVFVKPFKYVNETLQKLTKMSYGRKYFSLDSEKSRSEACDMIAANTEKNKMQSKISKSSPDFVGRWWKISRTFDESNRSEYSKYALNYYLYSTPILDAERWAEIKENLKERLAADREEQKSLKNTGIVNSAAVICDSADESVLKEVLLPLNVKISDTLTLSGIRVCVGVPKENKYYLCAEWDGDKTTRSYRSLDLLSKLTLGVKAGKLSLLGNEPTEAYTALLAELSEMSLSDFIKNEKAKERAEKAELDEKSPGANMSEGEIKRKGDIFVYIDNGVEVDAWITLPEDAIRAFDEQEEDFGDLEDMCADIPEGDEEEPEPSVPEDYRGPIVLEVSDFGLKGGKLKFIFKKQKERAFLAVREHLLAEGFEKVYRLNEKKKTFEE